MCGGWGGGVGGFDLCLLLFWEYLGFDGKCCLRKVKEGELGGRNVG